MKSYTITVNGTAYEVTVEETTGTGAAAVPAMPRPAAQTAPMPAAPAAAPAAAPTINCAVGDPVEAGTLLATID